MNLDSPIQIEFQSSTLQTLITGEYIALTHQFQSINHSIIHYLYDGRIIKTKSFALDMSNTNNSHSDNFICIGGISSKKMK